MTNNDKKIRYRGKNNPFYGRHHTEEAIEKIRKAHLGKTPHKGKKHTEETKEKMRQKALGREGYWRNKKRPEMSGENHPNWIKDRTEIKGYWIERNNPEYKQWVKQCKKRDNWKCRINNNDCSGYCIVHHILSWKDFLELRYNVNNGITLCQYHHPRKRVDEQRLIPIFKELVGSKV